MPHLFGGGHVDDLIGHLGVLHPAIRGFDEAVFVDPREGGEGVDQADIRPLRRLDRAHAAIVGRVNVANLKASAFARQAARTKRRKAALVRHLGQRVGLVHELAELRGAEEFANRRGGGFRVDQVLRHDRVDLDRGHTLLDRALHPQQADAVLVFHQLADRTDAAVAEMVDIVHLATTVAQIHQGLDDGLHVFGAQGSNGVLRIQLKAHVHLHAAHGAEVVTLRVVEQAVEQCFRRLKGRRLARAHDPVDIQKRGFAVQILVDRHRVSDVGADSDVIDVERRDRLDAIVEQNLNILFGQLFARLDPDLAGGLVNHVLGCEAAIDRFERREVGGDAILGHFLELTRGQLLTGLGDNLARLGVDQVERGLRAAQTLHIKRGRPALALLRVRDLVEEVVTDAFLIHAKGIEQRRHRQLPATVDADIDIVLRVKFEVEPGAAIGDDPRGEQELARRMGLALVMVEEDARRAVHLRDDDTLRAVNDEGAVFGHQRQVAHKDVLFLDVFDRPRAGILIHLKDDQPQRDLQRAGERHIALLAFFNVIFRRFELVFHELQNRRFVEILDREHRLEDTLNAFAVGRLRAFARIQEKIVGAFLHLDQVGHLRDFANLAKEFTDALTSGMRLNHYVLGLSPAERRWAAHAAASRKMRSPIPADHPSRLPGDPRLPSPLLCSALGGGAP